MLAWDEGRERDKSIQQVKVHRRPRSQSSKIQLLPLLSRRQKEPSSLLRSLTTTITPLLPPGLNCSHFLAARERPPGGKPHTHHPAGHWWLGVSADSNWDRQQIHLSGNILPHMCLEKGHKILDWGSTKLDKSCCQTDVLECPKQEHIFVGSAADGKRISEKKGTIWGFTHPLLSQHSSRYNSKFLSDKIHYKF